MKTYSETLLVKAMKSYLQGNIDKHITNIKINLSNTVGVAEHSDHIQTIEKELGVVAEYEDKLAVLNKYFGGKDKEVING